jgi:hypothetical protein
MGDTQCPPQFKSPVAQYVDEHRLPGDEPASIAVPPPSDSDASVGGPDPPSVEEAVASARTSASPPSDSDASVGGPDPPSVEEAVAAARTSASPSCASPMPLLQPRRHLPASAVASDGALASTPVASRQFGAHDAPSVLGVSSLELLQDALVTSTEHAARRDPSLDRSELMTPSHRARRSSSLLVLVA